MAQAGYELPEDVPDPTFKRPPWMKKEAGDIQGSLKQ
jgi:hypothetical protein